MSFQAYLDNIKAKTGKTPADFAKLAAKKGPMKHGEMVKWLKDEHALGHGHATAIAAVLLKSGSEPKTPAARIDKLFSGKKEVWRASADDLFAKVKKFGPDITISAGDTYVSLLHGKKKFGILQPMAGRLDIGIKLNDADAYGRFEASGSWNSMVTHRVRVETPKKIDAEILSWLKRAYHAAER